MTEIACLTLNICCPEESISLKTSPLGSGDSKLFGYIFPPISSTNLFSLYLLRTQLGGWAVSGQWNQTDFNTTLGLLMRDYNTFPFFNIYVGKDPYEAARGINKKYIQASMN